MKDVKIKLSALWVFLAVNWIADLVFSIYMQGMIEKIIAGEAYIGLFGKRLMAIGIIFFLIPMIMALLSLYLKDSQNRWANIIVGVVFVFIGVFFVYDHMSYPIYLLMKVPNLVVAVIIVWHAWKWSKQDA
jgi:uncharacterized membrane protein YecN with MAPEG domain